MFFGHSCLTGMLYIATFFLMSKTNSPDLIHDEINKLAELFPQFVSEGKVDIAWLQSYLDGQTVEGERYNMNRHGKSKAKLIAREPSTATLRPDVSQSKNRESTGNMLIEWDNLEVLKLLQNHYYEKIKCIYIDPPYNKDKDFVYRDTRKDPVGNYMRITGQIDDEWEITTENNETTGRKHSNWLSMMYPRLYLARKLLKDDGVIFVSIDDDEVANLRKLMDEIFGEENFVCEFIREKKKKPSFLDRNIGKLAEYIICYSKHNPDTVGFSIEKTTEGKKYPINNAWNSLWTLIFPPLSVNFNLKDWIVKKQDMSEGNIITRLLHDLVIKDWKNENELILEWEWRYSQSTLNEIIEDSDEIKISQIPFRPNHVKKWWEVKKMKNILSPHHYSMETNEDWSNQLIELFWRNIFDNPKPLKLIKTFMNAITNNDDIILDFFAWSWSTWHAVMDLNAEDNGNRKYILVQLPEEIQENQEAYKAWYRKISEITRDRLLKAGEKIGKWDTGFRFFKLDTSNFAELNPIVIKEWETTDEQLFDRLSLEADSFGIKTERSDDDIITELLIRYGYSLHSKIEQDSKFPTWYHITDISESEKSFFLSLEDTVSDDDIARFVKCYHNHNQTVFVCKDDAISSGSRLTLANYFLWFTTL